MKSFVWPTGFAKYINIFLFLNFVYKDKLRLIKKKLKNCENADKLIQKLIEINLTKANKL